MLSSKVVIFKYIYVLFMFILRDKDRQGESFYLLVYFSKEAAGAGPGQSQISGIQCGLPLGGKDPVIRTIIAASLGGH